MNTSLNEHDHYTSRRIRLATLTNIRWLAVLGQSTVLALVSGYLEYPLPIMQCITLVAMSAALNLFNTWRFPAIKRIGSPQALITLLFDTMQLAALLYLTGGMTNPFAILLIVPAIISAATLPPRFTAVLSVSVAVAATLLAFWHLPLPWIPGSQISFPFVYILGIWGAVVSCLLFATFYVYRVAGEARRLSDALASTELVIQREQHLSDLDGMAAAAAHELGTPLATISLVAKEMDRAVQADNPLKEDIGLMRGQADRCREILSRLSTLGSDNEDPISRIPLLVMIEEIIAPHREFGVEIVTQIQGRTTNEPIELRNSGLMYGLGNIVENAVDFAKTNVSVEVSWNETEITVRIKDDGPGFETEQLVHLGEPEVGSVRGATRTRKGSSGLGLGIFIAKTLMERNGARVYFANGSEPGVGAVVKTIWPKSSISK